MACCLALLLLAIVPAFSSKWVVPLFDWCSRKWYICLVVVAVCQIWILRILIARWKQPVLQTFVWARLTYAEASEWRQCASGHKPSVRFEPHSINQFPENGTLRGTQAIAGTNQQSTDQASTAEANARPPAVAPTPGIISQTEPGHAMGFEFPPICTERIFQHNGDDAQLTLANGIQAHGGIPQRAPPENMEETEDPPMSVDSISQHSSDVEQGILVNNGLGVLEATAELIEQITDRPLTAGTHGRSPSLVPTHDSNLQADPIDAGPQIGISPRRYGAGTTAVLCCPCCLDDMKDADVIALLRCGHMFCEVCLKLWAAKSSSCPICRASMLTS